MAGTPAQIHLTEQEQAILREWTRKDTAEQRLVDRARMILFSHEGLTVEKIAERLLTRPARVPIRFGGFCASTVCNCSGAGVGASPQIRSSGRRPPTWCEEAAASRRGGGGSRAT